MSTEEYGNIQCIPTPMIWVNNVPIELDRITEEGAQRITEDGTQRVEE